MRNFLKSHIYYIFILGLVIGLYLANLTPHLMISGWDSLQTELYPWLGVKRAFFAVWQEYQSFGLVSGMAHAADLLRALFIAFLSLILPLNIVRYSFLMLMVAIGATGTYTLFGLNSEKTLKAKFYPFLGACFYMLNLGTIQIFSLPYEPFAVFFAALPWEIWIFLRYIKYQKAKIKDNHAKNLKFKVGEDANFVDLWTSRLRVGSNGIKRNSASSQLIKANFFRRDLLLLFLINLLATPQAYLQTLFVVYMLFLGAVAVGLYWQTQLKSVIKNSAIAIAIILAVNSFWILPELYFLKTTGNVVTEAKINQVATPDVFYQNREKGNLTSFLKLEGFYFDLHDITRKPLFEPWKKHLGQPLMGIIPYLFALIFAVGFFSKNKNKSGYLAALFVVAVALLASTPPFSKVNDLLRQNLFINQMFRSPFTKFIIPYALIFSFFFMEGTKLISQKLKDVSPKFRYLTLLPFLLIVIYALPAFNGQFIAGSMRTSIPKDYYEVAAYFKKSDKNSRVALLPEYTYWGWFFHNWKSGGNKVGYDGSGFLWYAIEQPIISRTFDVWSSKSEGYLFEMKAAVEAENLQAFERVIRKYNINYLLQDLSLRPVSATLRGLQQSRLTTLLSESKIIEPVYLGQSLKLYKVPRDKKVENFVTTAGELINVGPLVKTTNQDTAYESIGDYKTTDKSDPDIYFPFLDFYSQTRDDSRKWTVEDKGTYFDLKTKLDIDPELYDLLADDIEEDILLHSETGPEEYLSKIDIAFEGRSLSISFPKKLLKKIDPTQTEVKNCGQGGNIERKNKNTALFIESRRRAVACFGYDINQLEQKHGYLMGVSSQNIKGGGLFLYILDLTKKQSYLEDRITNGTKYFITAPRYPYGIGYNITFHNQSYLNQSFVNQLDAVNIYYLPYNLIKSIRLAKRTIPKPVKFLDGFKSQHKNYWTYEVEAPNEAKSLILYQAYHPGWTAYNKNVKCHPFGKTQDDPERSRTGQMSNVKCLLFGEKLEHFTVNNWANGWSLSESQKSKVKSQKLIVVFWPQYLEYIGFAILVTCFILILKKGRKSYRA